MPGYVVPPEPFFLASLASSPRDPGDQEERFAEARRELGDELEQSWVSRPIFLVQLTLSLFRPMLSPEHPTPFSAERVVVQPLNLVFGRNKPAQKESVTIE